MQSAVDEVAEERAAHRGKDEDGIPDANLAGMLVEAEHVFDEGKADGLSDALCETLECA